MCMPLVSRSPVTILSLPADMIRRLLLAVRLWRDPWLSYTLRGAWRAAARHL